MKREHKFRAWDTLQGGKFEYWDSKTNKYDGIFWEMIKNKSFKEPNEFTGLKDKNGKEIYEGDILNLKTTFENNMADRRFQPATEIEVGFEDGYFLDINTRIALFEKMMIVSSYPSKHWTNYEVIRNIYENPELIK